MGFRIDAKNLISGLDRLEIGMGTALDVYARTVAQDFETNAKLNRPWTDRTNRARLGLTGYVQKTENGYRIIIAHTVDYGIYLEYAHEKRFAILEPTVRFMSPYAVAGLEHLVDRLKELRR